MEMQDRRYLGSKNMFSLVNILVLYLLRFKGVEM